MKQIKEDYIKKIEKKSQNNSPFLVDIIGEEDGEGCAACFV
jgi:uncharacterized protein (UPF0218 family)